MKLNARQLQELSDAIEGLRAEEIELIQQRLDTFNQLGLIGVAVALACASLFPFTP